MEKSSYYESLHDTLYKLLTEYASVYDAVKSAEDWKNPFRNIIGNDIPSLLQKCAEIELPYKVIGSYGKGRWTAVPWIAVFDSRITTSAQKGVYIVYLLNKDTKELYLTLEIAATEAIGTKLDSEGKAVFYGVVGKNDPELKAKLQERANQIRAAITDTYFSSDDKINSGAQGYDYGSVYYKKYTVNNLPNGEILTSDLKRMIDIYSRYYYWVNNLQMDFVDKSEGEVSVTNINTKDTLSEIKSYIFARGFDYPDGLIENFYLSLKSKPFVILAGTSGTGKTRLVKLFAEAIGAVFKLVSVRPDWSDGSDLFGHYDLNGKFIDGPVCECFKAALENPDKPVFLCLDEMNLARVEYYLSDFLSVIESREKQPDGRIRTEKIEQYDGGIPDNLYVVGTVNMDETTFPFSKKVLDRANTIEFSYVDLMPEFDGSQDIPEPLKMKNDFLRTEYLVLAKDCAEDADYVQDICAELQKINEILKKANAHVGYRVRDEIVFYMLNNQKAELLEEDAAMDNQIMQKILPRIQGSSTAVKNMMIELFKFCAGTGNGIDTDAGDAGKTMISMAHNAKYPKSAEKIGYMMTRFEEDGFTSYWL